MADKKGFSRSPASSQRSTESCCSCCAAKVASSGEGIASQWKYAFNIESKWRWQRNYQRERQMDMDISAACQAHKWSEQVMTCTCRSMHAQVRRGLQQKFKFFIYKLQTFAKDSIWLEVQRTMDELLGIYIEIYLWVSVYLFSLSKLIIHLPAQGTFELTGKDDNKLRTTFRGSSRGSHICIVNKATNLCRLVTPSLFADTNFRLIGNRRATCQPASPCQLPVKKQNTSSVCSRMCSTYLYFDLVVCCVLGIIKLLLATAVCNSHSFSSSLWFSFLLDISQNQVDH